MWALAVWTTKLSNHSAFVFLLHKFYINGSFSKSSFQQEDKRESYSFKTLCPYISVMDAKVEKVSGHVRACKKNHYF